MRSLKTAAPLAALALVLALGCQAQAPAPEATEKTAPEEKTAIVLTGVGFSTPEAILHDGEADVYLVSQINGSPLETDGNGFVSRVSPNGTVAELRWIDGRDEDTELHAPKGMALAGERLYVADIAVDVVRRVLITPSFNGHEVIIHPLK